MRPDTLRTWLEEKGCRFDEKTHERGHGHASVVAKLAGRVSVFPAIGAHEDMDKADVVRIVRELGLEGEDLPSGEDTETAKYRHGTSSRG